MSPLARSALFAGLAATAAALIAPAVARAQRRPRGMPLEATPGVVAALTPWTPADPPGDPRYLRVLTLRTTTWTDAEVVADRRLLRFDVSDPASPRARPLPCVHPAAPRFRPDSPRVRALGGAASYREWIDLRMYCSGRALDRLERGGRAVARYGHARGPRRAWVARPRGGAADVAVATLAAGEIVLSARTAPTNAAPAPEARVTLASVTRATGDVLALEVGVRATSGARVVYLRHDFARFRVRGPLGALECGLEPTPLAPIVDLFRPVSARAAATIRVDARQACRGAFPIAGIYEVTPVVALPWAFPGDAARAITGEYVGEPAVVRITEGDRGYVEHIPDGASAP